MRSYDKKNQIKKANILVEQRFIASKMNESFHGPDGTPIAVDSKHRPVKKEETNKVDKVTVDVPLLIRLMEFSKEDAVSDMDLHVVAENLTKLSENGDSLTMDDYEAAIKGAKVNKTEE